MSQVSPFMRKSEVGYHHWCPGCERLHTLPKSWGFDGNLARPTFSPSFLQMPSPVQKRCHYNVVSGQLVFHGDSDHAYAGRTVYMPPLPAEYQDFCDPVEIP